MKKSELIPVVVYYRCSSPQQELSVADQRREVEAYCRAKGYRIVAEYVDEGKSASKNEEKRIGFHRMVRDSAGKGFEVVVCYDAARFTRFHNIDGSDSKRILLGNGVILDTVKEGVFDWRTPEGRWKDMAYCENNHAAALNLSKDSIRGRTNIIGLGYWPNGVVPYGYDRLYTDGVHVVNVKRGVKYSKGRNWHCKLVVNEGEALIVREIFTRFGKGESRRQIAIDLTARGIPAPSGQNGWNNGAWDADNIVTVLTEKAYIGIATTGTRRRPKVAHNRIPPTEHPGACPAVLPAPALFHAVQELLKARRDGKRPPTSRRAAFLSGFCFCGHCGFRLNKKMRPGGKDGPRVGYICMSAGFRPHLGCRNYEITEADILPRVCAFLREEIDEEVLAGLQAKPPENGCPEEAVLLERVKALEAKVGGATESALLAPAHAREAAWALVGKWQGELEAARGNLALAEAMRSQPALQNFALWWEENKDKLVDIPAKWSEPVYDPEADWTVRTRQEAPVATDRDTLRALLETLGLEVKVWWEKVDRKNRNQRQFVVKDVQISISVDLDAVSVGGDSSATTGANRFGFKRLLGTRQESRTA